MATTAIYGEPRISERRKHVWEARRDKRNVGGPERGLRLLLGIGALAVAPVARRGWRRGALATAGLMGLLTGIIGYCPANEMRGRDSFHRLR